MGNLEHMGHLFPVAPYHRNVPDLATLPADLAGEPVWCVGRFKPKPGKPGEFDKIPVSPRSGGSSGWGKGAAAFGCTTASEAIEFLTERPDLHCLGVILDDAHDLSGGDIDDCMDGGELTEEARGILDDAGTYAEFSVGQAGVRFLFRGDFGGHTGNNHAIGVEFYESGRFLTVTGWHIQGTPKTVERRNLAALGAQYFERKPTEEAPTSAAPDTFEAVDIDRLALSSRTRQQIREGVEPGKRSDAIWGCCKDLIKAGCSDATICRIMADPSNGISSKALGKYSGDILGAMGWIGNRVAQARAEVQAETAEAFDDTTATESGGFDLSAARVDDMLTTTPPRRDWLIRDRLPLGVVGIMGAAGGTGKGFATLQLAVALATGEKWLGMDVGRQGATLILSAEDDRDEIHRRLAAVVEHYETADPFAEEWETATIREDVARRLFVLDRVGEDNRLTVQIERETMRSGLADRIVETVQAMEEPPVLIVLDPLARFDGGDPNDNADGTRLIETAEHIRKATGATVLLPHHVAKGSIRDMESGQEAIRGASALVDGARWAGLMATLRTDDAKKYGVEPEQAKWYVRFNIVKGNYGPPWEGCWLRKLPGGVLEATELQRKAGEAKEIRGEQTYQRVLDGARKLIRKHGPMSARHIRNNYAGAGGLLGASDKPVRAALSRAVEEGELFAAPTERGTGEALHLSPGAE